ncbi:MAG: hypothetical protein AAF581_09470 [Planctomycetota bacterium]
MPRISVTLLRWLLAAGNISLLALVGFIAVDFFHLQGDGQGLRAKLERPSSVKVKISRKPDANYPQLVPTLYLEAPKPKPVKKKPEVVDTDLPPEAGGPLKQWELTSVVVDSEGSWAFIAEKVQENPSARRTSGGRRSGSSRGRSNRRSSGPKRDTKSLWVGKVFRECEIEEILTNPPRVYYAHGEGRQRRQYILEQEPVESSTLEIMENGKLAAVVIDGMTEEELHAKEAEAGGAPTPGRGPRGRPSAEEAEALREALNAMPKEKRGAIRDAMNKKTPTKPRAKPTNTKRQPAKRQPAKRQPAKRNNNARTPTKTGQPRKAEVSPKGTPPESTRKPVPKPKDGRATKHNPRSPGKPGHRDPYVMTPSEKREAARVSEMTPEERERWAEEQERRQEEQQEQQPDQDQG